MNLDRQRRIEQLFHEAVELNPAEQAQFLDRECEGDPSLKQGIDLLLRAHGKADRLMRSVDVTLADGTIGPYEVKSLIGSGGMGDVYHARDRRLERSVAIKVLSADLVHDSQFRSRFQREARVLASLNHPNIASLYGLEESGGRLFLVMELVSGETLATRLARGKLSFEETVRYGSQIADALAAAHAGGIIHRDLKPGNIMIAKSGAKVLDFGLAKSVEDETLTASRVVMGTPAYMAPEQRAGKDCDARTDVYALGLILYEMATGNRFTPEASGIEGIPAKLAHVIERCLEKDPDERWQTASDIKHELIWSAKREQQGVPQRRSALKASLLTIAALIVGVGLGVAGVTYFRSTPSAVRLRTVRLSIPQAGSTAITISGQTRDFALTPDGSRIVYVGNDATQLFVRSLDAREPVAIANGTALQSPFVSPDGQWVGYLDNAYVLKKVAITGGVPVTLTGRGRFGATWLPDDTIVYGGSAGLSRISAIPETSNETPEMLTHTASGEASHVWPEVLPANRGILFTISAQDGGLDASQIAVFDLRTRNQKILFRGGSAARYFANPSAPAGGPSGYLAYVARGTLRSVPFDLDTLETRGTAAASVPVLVADVLGDADFAVDANGTLAYVDAPAWAPDASRSLVWVDRSGKEEIAAPPGAYLYVRVSPDESRLALIAVEGGERNLIVWDLHRRAFTRLKFDLGRVVGSPLWMPDGKRIIFQARVGNESVSMWWMPADGTGTPERLATSRNPQLATSVSADGSQLVYHEATPDSSIDILQMTLDGTHKITPLLHTKSWELGGMISPDGRWLAYQCCTDSQPEIQISPYPNVEAGRWQLSTGGGRSPVWSPMTKELFYIASDASIMRVPVEATGSAWQAGSPTRLFDSRYFKASNYERTYDISRDGRRLLIIKPPSIDANATPPQIVIVQNWVQELTK